MNQRILFVIESLFPLGPAQPLKLLCIGLAQRQYDVHVAVLGQKKTEPDDWTDQQIKVHFLNGDDTTPLHTARDGFYVIKMLRQLIRLTEPTILHPWCGWARFFALMATTKAPLLRPLEPMRIIATELSIEPEKRFIRQWLENHLSQRIEKTVVSHASAMARLEENGTPQSEITVIENAVPSNLVADREKNRAAILQKLNLPPKTYLAAAAAPLEHRSRLKDLIWATDLLTCIRDDFHLLIIGSGWQQKRLRRFAALTEAKPHIHFLGEPESAPEIISCVDFYWHSHFHDPISSNLLTAMAAGVPAISVYGPGTEEIIRHQETGFAVNFGARDEFARWTKYLIEQKPAGSLLAKQGQQHVQKHFQASQMIQRYVDLYES